MGLGASGAYLPVVALPYWDRIGPYVNGVVARCQGLVDRDPESLYAALTPFVLWCWQTRGFVLDDERVFQARVIEQFIQFGMSNYLLGTRATLRSTLWRVLEVMAPEEARVPRRPIKRSDPTRPYSNAEVAELFSWAQAQTTEHRRDDALALLSLGLGAGLPTRELLAVSAEDCVVEAGSCFVRVRGSRAREVPFLDDWCRTVVRLLARRQSNLLFRPGRESASEGQVTDFVSRSRTSYDVRPARMRTTWLLAHLEKGTSPASLLRISGLGSLASLDRIAGFAPRARVNPVLKVGSQGLLENET